MSKKEVAVDLKTPDVFVSTSDKIFKFVEDHFKIFGGAFAAVILGAVIFGGYNWWSHSQEEKATTELYTSESQLQKLIQSAAEAKSKAPIDQDFSSYYGSQVEKMKSEIARYGSTKAGLVSALNLSAFLIQKRQFDSAVRTLEAIKFKPSESDVLGFVRSMQLGVAMLESGQAAKAVAVFESITKNPNAKAFQSEALLKLGMSYESSGDVKKARDAYDRVAREFPETMAAQSAQQYIRLLDMQSGGQG